ncbi:TonB-dependent siderophore receptor [Nostoc sp.]|uniref:TonB-dependent siderophore receptor n=1 Tax=Nostoc sp. TaxID=1180 RepID=UPI002FF6C96B
MMKLLRRRSPSWTSLFISCFFIAVVIQPTQAKQVTEIPSVQELDRSARTVKEWFAQIEQQNPAAQSQEAEVVQVTSVKANPTSSGVEVILQTLKGQQLQVVNRSSGNNFIADIPNAQLRLPSGDAFTFRSTKPIAGVSEITVTNFDANTIRVSVTGEAGVPQVELFDSPDEGIILSVATAASRAQQPQRQPTQPQQPGSQTQPSLPSPASNQPIELVVTGEQDQGYNPSQTSVGTRTDTPLRDIPNTIQIVPQQVIKDRNVTNVNSALENVSGVQQSFGNISVRGFTAQQTVDGGLSGAADFSNVEQVEVLRGPAAVLFGAGGLGGIINITTKQPLFEPYYELGLNAGNDSVYRGTADLSGPLTSNRNLRYRLNIALQDAHDSRNFSSSQELFIAPTIAWDISNDTKLTVNLEYINTPSKSYGVRALNGSFLGRDPNYDYPDDTYTDSAGVQGGYRFEHRFNKNLQLRNSLAFSSGPGHGRGINYGTLSDQQFIDRTYADDKYVYETYTTQTGLLANFNTGSIAHQALFGVDTKLDRQRFFGFGISLRSLDISNPDYDIARPSADTPHTSDYNQQYNTDSYGVFLQDQIKFLDNLILVVAGRLDWVTITASDYVAGTADTNYSATFSPRIGIVYQPIKPLSLYANYSRALDTADITGRRTRMGETFAPSLSTQYEAGIKTDFLDGKLSAVLAAYQITRTNVLTPDPLNNADEDFNIQIGEQRSRGIDFSVTGEILPGWNLTAGYSYINAIITKDEVYGVGSPVVFTPHNSANLWTTYRIQSGNLQGLGFGLGVYFVDERPGGEFISRDYKIPAYTRLDAALFYRRNNWEAALNFENLFDSDYIVNSRGPGSETFGPPFTIRGSVKVRF